MPIKDHCDVYANKFIINDGETGDSVASQAIEGDWVTVESDGTNWYVRGQSNVTEGVTLTDAA